MHGYLVVLRHNTEDLPVALVGDRVQAMDLADKLEPFATARIREIYRLETTSPATSVMVIRFMDGVPVEWAYNRDLTEDE